MVANNRSIPTGSAARQKMDADVTYRLLMILVITVFAFLCIYPLYFVLIASISAPDAVANGQVVFWPHELQVSAYRIILNNRNIWQAYANSIQYTVIGTILNVFLTMLAGFVFSRRHLIGSRFYLLLIIFTMYFSGGLIPTYLIVRQLGLLDSMWALILPGLISTYNLIIARTFIETTIPDALEEQAQIDGCSHLRYFLKIILPLSGPIIGVLTLYYAVGHWNSYMDALVYLRDRQLYPLQLVLREILVQSQLVSAEISATEDVKALMDQLNFAQAIKYTVIIVSILPMMIIYPLMQRYFVKGIMIGSIKE